MTPTELFKAGHLQQAIDAQIQEVKASPGDQGKRLFLFELLTFAGDLDRAMRQINAVTYGQLELDVAVHNYGNLLNAENSRRKLFREGVRPNFLMEAPDHVKLRLDAVDRLRDNQPAEATALLAKAHEATPAVAGRLNDKPFKALRDCDDLFAGVLEVMAKGKYFWVPLDQVVTLGLNAPRFPRDLIWVPAHLEMGGEGATGEVWLPALYPMTHEHADDQVRLGRSTDWVQADGGPVLGRGVRTFLVDDDAVGLLEWREVEIDA
jgi:type VI secretion system protein ImpE